MKYLDFVRSTIVGRLAMTTDEALLLEHCLLRHPGIHVEIGVLWGGTLALAALAKGRSGICIGIDPMATGFWVDGDPVLGGLKMSPRETERNLARCGVKASIIQKPSNPWPLTWLEFSTALIDGDHSAEALEADWTTLREVVTDLIFIHDYNSPRHPGVQKAVDDMVLHAREWERITQVGTLLVMGHK